MNARDQADVTTGDGLIPADGNDGNDGDDLDDLDDLDETDDLDEPDEDLMEQLRRADPVDVEALPSSRSAKAMRTLKAVLDSDDEAESEAGSETETD